MKNGYQPRTRVVNDEKVEMVADCHSIMARWKNNYSQILNVHVFSDVRQAEIQTAEPLVPETSVLKYDLAIEKLKSHKSRGIDQIPAELIKAGGSTIRCVNHKLIIAIWNVAGLRPATSWGCITPQVVTHSLVLLKMGKIISRNMLS